MTANDNRPTPPATDLAFLFLLRLALALALTLTLLFSEGVDLFLRGHSGIDVAFGVTVGPRRHGLLSRGPLALHDLCTNIIHALKNGMQSRLGWMHGSHITEEQSIDLC